MIHKQPFEFKNKHIYLDMTFFDLSVLNMLPKMVADGSEGWMHLYAEITSESYGCFIDWAFLFTVGEGSCVSHMTKKYL